MIIELGRYYFVFAITFIWLVFASVQDWRKREISNWVNFSLIAFGLLGKFIYSLAYGEWNWLSFGLIGFVLFYFLALAIYYSGAFGGGDAKLLMALGAILPFGSLIEVVLYGGGFLILLMFVGAIYGLGYSVFVMAGNYYKFKKEFRKNIGKKWIIDIYAVLIILIAIASYVTWNYYVLLFLGLFILLPLLYVYTKAVDSCMVEKISSKDIQEGDWIVGEIKIAGKMIKNGVNGIGSKEVQILRGVNKAILVRYGVPFAPAFLISFMLFVASLLLLNFEELILSLSFLF